MHKFLNTYVIVATFVLLALCSCTKDEGGVQQEDATRFVLETKASAPVGTTFRIMAYGRQEDNIFNYISSGTYCLLDGKEFNGVPYLSSAELSDDGVFVQENGTCALAIPYGELYREKFYVSYVSPGLINTNGGFTVDVANAFYTSNVQCVDLYNYGVVEMSNPLIDRRAKIGFKIYKGDLDIVVENFRISGAGNVYWPATNQVTPKDGIIELGGAFKEAAANEENLVYECVENDMPFMLSGIYAPKDTVAAYISKPESGYELEFAPVNLQESGYLNAKFDLTIDGKTTEMVVPLTKKVKEISPLTTYVYNITITSAFIHTILEISPINGANSWDDVEVGFEIEDNSVYVDLGSVSYSDWDDLNWGDIEIDNPDNN